MEVGSGRPQLGCGVCREVCVLRPLEELVCDHASINLIERSHVVRIQAQNTAPFSPLSPLKPCFAKAEKSKSELSPAEGFCFKVIVHEIGRGLTCFCEEIP